MTFLAGAESLQEGGLVALRVRRVYILIISFVKIVKVKNLNRDAEETDDAGFYQVVRDAPFHLTKIRLAK